MVLETGGIGFEGVEMKLKFIKFLTSFQNTPTKSNPFQNSQPNTRKSVGYEICSQSEVSE